MDDEPDEKARIDAQRTELARVMAVMTEENSDVPFSLSPEVVSTALDRYGADVVRWALHEDDTEAVKLVMGFALERGCGPEMRAAILAAYDQAGVSVETPKKRRGRPSGPRSKEPTKVGPIDGDAIAWSVYHHMTTPDRAGYSAGLDWAEAHYGLSRKRLRELDKRLHRRLAGLPLT